MLSNYKIDYVKAFRDNYIWIVQNSSQAIIVDPGYAVDVIKYLDENNLTPTAILLTHNHADHNGGVSDLVRFYPTLQIFNYSDDLLPDGETISIDGFAQIKVIASKGHTSDHVCYLFDKQHLFCGDTLFSLGCGRVFTNDFIAAYESLCKIKQLDKNILCYPAHEYTANNLQFIMSIDHDTQYYQEFKNDLMTKLNSKQISLPTLLSTELSYNLFLRCENEYVWQVVARELGIKVSSELECFVGLRELRNKF